jgi:ribosomal protein L11 methyltransferase
MEYTELSIDLSQTAVDTEVLTAVLAEYGFESFSEENGTYKAYVQSELYLKEPVIQWLEQNDIRTGYSIQAIPDQNWNAVWESNFEPVVIAGQCYVRAPFHKPQPQYPVELLIEPQMSFGTAHHETTSQMIALMLNESFQAKDVLDMGCGTGILAVLAAKKGAQNIWAIDNDDWAYRNSLQNMERNNTMNVQVLCGDASLLGQFPKMDVILANINRNILLSDIKHYRNSLKNNGILFLSGFYEHDLPSIEAEAASYQLKLTNFTTDNNWVAARFESIEH